MKLEFSAFGVLAILPHFRSIGATPTTAHSNRLTQSIGSRGSRSCNVIPGDNLWPSIKQWNSLNSTVNGRLIASVPQAAVCHASGYGNLTFDASKCDALKAGWNYPQTYEPISSEIMNPYYQNRSCDPFNTNKACELGNYVSYAINVTGVSDIVAGIHFSKSHNVRLVIKNTGHDFLGKSTGKGGLSLWTHNMKSMEIIPEYSGGAGNYSGPAGKFGAGVAGYDAIGFVGPQGFRVVSGECPTVGFTGGYTQGGGHSFLNSELGMAADQVLEWEVVTADSKHLIATPVENQDLYWALSGGGGGTFGVVVSMTVRIYHEAPMGTAAMSFNATAAVSNEAFVEAIAEWWQFLPSVVDTGATVLWSIRPSMFYLESFTAPNKTAEQVSALFAPYLATLDRVGVKYQFSSGATPTYYQHYNESNGPLPYGVYPTTMLFNSRLIPRAVSLSAKRAMNLTETMDKALNSPVAAGWPGWGFGCNALNVANSSHPDNAVTPHWRNAIAICIEIALFEWDIPWEDMMFRKEYLSKTITPTIKAATPDGGAYLNEAEPLVYNDSAEHWQQAFYGDIYPRLRAVKQKWDPSGLFYAFTAVGSEDFAEDGDGRICRV